MSWREVFKVVGLTSLVLATSVAAQEDDESAEGEAVVSEDDVVSRVEESMSVIGIRAGEEVPVTKQDIDRQQIQKLSFGQDAPQLLQYTPSMTWYSDSGIGSNYSYLSLRGIQQTRINMTFDGAPLNDPAEHAVYFNNFNDFTNVVDSIQIQRGVGTSSVGSPSYGGSVNFASAQPADQAEGDLRLILGSYNTKRASVAYESGLLANGLSVGGRFSYADTDGYRDNSGTEHRTFFLNAGWQGERSSLKLVSFSGDVETQLAWLAVEPWILEEDRQYNPLDEQERDDFGQDFAQLKFTHAFSNSTLISASLYYNGAAGWFRLWDDPAAQNQLQQFGIDQAFVGSMVTVSMGTDRLSSTLGLHYNDFSGDHTLDIEGEQIYRNTGFKQTANSFAKLEFRLGDWVLFGDFQLRWADFSYRGDIDLGSVDWNFFDPKIGARWVLSPGSSIYASIGRAQREPTRMDLLLGEDNATIPHDLEAVRPEEVLDLEAGINYNTSRLVLQANLYAMEFTNEIALTGELSEIGLPLRRNVDDSYRRGLEVDLKWQATPTWAIMHSANLSRNRIEEWQQFYDVYDESGAWIGSEPITYRDVRPLLTPDAVLNLGAEWTPRIYSIALIGRYVADAQLDNTGLSDFRLPSSTNLDLRASVALGSRWQTVSPRITLFVNNLLDNLDQFPSGYSYQYLVENQQGQQTLDGIPYYYPLAGRNAVVSLELDL